MRIHTRAGDLAFKTFTFPDGQPHFKLETYEREFDEVTIEMAIKTPADLFMVVLACSVLRSCGYACINLDVRYLLAARMDRSISWAEPFTLSVVAHCLNSCGFSRVRILDVHSDVALKLIRNSENVLSFSVVEQIIASNPSAAIVIPDKGATDRVLRVSRGSMGYIRDVVRCEKSRDMATGTLTGFRIADNRERVKDASLLIIDDICDGGGTFTGLAKELRKAGAKKIFLYVTHGIFSKGLPLEGIDHVYTTDSYTNGELTRNENPTGKYWLDHVTVIPVSMEKL